MIWLLDNYDAYQHDMSKVVLQDVKNIRLYATGN